MKYIKLFEVKKNITSFVQAAKRGNSKQIKDMLKNGIDVNIRDTDLPRNTALMEVCLSRFLILEEILLKAGADPNIKNDHGRTALMMTSTMKMIDKMLEYKADVNIQNGLGDTAIMEYLEYGATAEQIILTIEKFKKYGLNLDIKNKIGWNFYDKIRYLENKTKSIKYSEIQDYMDSEFPQYKEEWEFQNDLIKYNL